MGSVTVNSSDVNKLELLLGTGDARALNELLGTYRPRLRRMIQLRLDRRLQGRVDASDVIQDAYLEAAARVQSFVRDRPTSFFVWLRFLVCEQLITLQRRHLGAAKRDASREISLYHGPLPEASSAMLAAQLVGSLTAPSQAAIRAELKMRLQEALNQMDAMDREIIALRHFEQLSRDETAETLGIEESAASKRYIRALKRLKGIIGPVQD
jgi:RNA polymerase sigma-70 factor (ECF subfamily)